MKPSNFSNFVGAGILAASLAVVPLTLPATAQTGTDTAPRQDNVTTPRTDVGTDGRTDVRTDTRTEGYDDGFDWGWLGLLGLLGLAGLARKREEPVRHREVERETDATRTGYPR